MDNVRWLIRGLVAAVLSIVCLQPAGAETDIEKIGRVTAYASYCGFYADVAAVRRKFERYPEFEKAYRANDLSGYDMVSGLNCAAVDRVMKMLVDHKGSKSSTEADEEKVHCLQPEAASTMLLPRSVCERLGGGIFPRETRVRP